jgi:hypothetical protein
MKTPQNNRRQPMSMHNKPEYNTPEIIAALIAHGMSAQEPSMLSDAFRSGYLAAHTDWKSQRCAECDCKFGGADCNWIKTKRVE